MPEGRPNAIPRRSQKASKAGLVFLREGDHQRHVMAFARAPTRSYVVKSFPVRQSKQPRPHAHGAPARISCARLLIMALMMRSSPSDWLGDCPEVLDACYRDFAIARYEIQKKLVRQSQCRRND